jgi:hypothetical protein
MSNFESMFGRLRGETAKMLGHNLDQISLVQSVRLDRAIALRIEIDRVQAQRAQYQPIDIGRLTTAREQLERLGGGKFGAIATGARVRAMGLRPS